MGKKLVAVFSLAVLLALLSGCVVQSQPTSGTGNMVRMGPDNFFTTSITIKKGQSIIFSDDQATGTTHILVIGQQGAPKAEDGAPDFGTNGIMTNPGDNKSSPPFMTPGIYHVTCTIHPQMNLTITVTA